MEWVMKTSTRAKWDEMRVAQAGTKDAPWVPAGNFVPPVVAVINHRRPLEASSSNEIILVKSRERRRGRGREGLGEKSEFKGETETDRESERA